MGEMEVPADALYGASTQRAVLNFPISGAAVPAPVHPRPRPHQARRRRDERASSASSMRTWPRRSPPRPREVADGAHDDQFPIDIYQTGSGTSTNTNMNEVVAHLAARPAGRRRKVHPNDDVNRCQSSNDVIPTALQLSAAMAIEEALLPALERLHTALVAQEQALWPVVKTGRTHLQDATPDPARPGVPRLRGPGRGVAPAGPGGPGRAARRCRSAGRPSGPASTRIRSTRSGPARGSSALTGLAVRETDNHFHAQATLDAAIAAHGAIRTIALSLWKIGSDVRLMGMGPRAGIAEIALPGDAAGLVDHAGQGEPGDHRDR